MPTSPLVTYLRLQRALDRDLLAMLRVTYAACSAELLRLQGRTGIGAAVRRDQLQMTITEINRQLSRYWASAGDHIQAAQYEAAAEAAEQMWSSPHLRRVYPAQDVDYLMRSARLQASTGLSTALERVSGTSYVPLAESVYNNQALTSGKIDDIVNAALGRGASAAELARDVRAFINPNVRGGVRYAAMRLGRTELNNAFHAAQVRSAVECPWVDLVKWNLSGSHPKPDECNQYAEDDNDGKGAGLWRPGSVPGKPHPNCLCYTTTVDIGRDEFIRRFEAGRFDSVVDEMMTTGGITVR